VSNDRDGSNDNNDSLDERPRNERPREPGGGIRDLVDRAIEWLADALVPSPAPVPVPVPVRRPQPRRR